MNVKNAILFGVATIATLCMCNGYANKKDVHSRDWRSQQVIWWRSDKVIKDVVLSGIELRLTHPDLLSDPSGAEHFSNIGELLLLFDSMSSPQSIDELASFAPYNLGASTSEIYSCLVLRKGRKIRNSLLKLKRSPENECLRTFGKMSNRFANEMSPAACLSQSEFKSRVNTLLIEISNNKTCTIEQ